MAAVIQLTTGQPGAGKTFSRVRFLVFDFLVNSTGKYITNLPLNVDLIVEDVSKRLACDPAVIRDRIVLIPESELDLWRKLSGTKSKELKPVLEQSFPPAVYFETVDLSNAHVAIDEFHLYFNRRSAPELKQAWSDWFAEIRKTGCTFEAITQDLSLLPPEFMGKVGIRVDLLPCSVTRDPFFGIGMSDWYEMKAGLLGSKHETVSQFEYRKTTSFTGRVNWVEQKADKFKIVPEVYKYYNTFTRNDGRKGGNRIPPHELYSKRGLIFWFMRRNFFKVFSRFALAVIMIWLCFGGGVNFLIFRFTGFMQTMAKANGAVPAKSSAPKPHQIKSGSRLPASGSSGNISSSGAGGQLAENTDIERLQHQAKEISDLKLEIEKLRQASIAECKPVMFFELQVWLRNGTKIKPGYKFKGGVYDGKIVKKIDAAERCYYLDDDTCVSM